jgi:hypothetical protein
MNLHIEYPIEARAHADGCKTPTATEGGAVIVLNRYGIQEVKTCTKETAQKLIEKLKEDERKQCNPKSSTV